MPEAKYRILLVEDNTDDAELTSRALRDVLSKDEILIANNGEEAYKLLFSANGTPTPLLSGLKVILFDIMLPGMSGLELLRKIKHNPESRSIAYILLTGVVDESKILESYQLGVHHFISKFEDPENFRNKLSSACRYWLEHGIEFTGCGAVQN